MEFLKSVQEIILKMRSLERYTNRNNFKIIQPNQYYKNLSKIDKRNIQFVESPDIVLKENRGFCYDQTFVAKAYLDYLNIENYVFYSCTNNIQKYNNVYVYTPQVISHVFIIYKDGDSFKWLQWSWSANINNNLSGNNISQILKQYRYIAEKSWHMPIILTNINDVKLKIPRIEFLNFCLSKQYID